MTKCGFSMRLIVGLDGQGLDSHAMRLFHATTRPLLLYPTLHKLDICEKSSFFTLMRIIEVHASTYAGVIITRSWDSLVWPCVQLPSGKPRSAD